MLLALLAGAVAGGFWGMIPGVLKIGRGQNEMIISIMLNYVATLFMGVIYTSWDPRCLRPADARHRR